MTLADQNAGVMVGLGQSQLEHLGLQATLQEVVDLQAEHVIELHAGLVQHSDADQTTQQGVTYEGRGDAVIYLVLTLRNLLHI